MAKITISKPEYAPIFGGLGFHDSEAGMYRLIPQKSFDESIAKCYREISPGFMRCFFGFSDQTREVMDDFADCYERMQKVTNTPIYMTPGAGRRFGARRLHLFRFGRLQGALADLRRADRRREKRRSFRNNELDLLRLSRSDVRSGFFGRICQKFH